MRMVMPVSEPAWHLPVAAPPETAGLRRLRTSSGMFEWYRRLHLGIVGATGAAKSRHTMPTLAFHGSKTRKGG